LLPWYLLSCTLVLAVVIIWTLTKQHRESKEKATEDYQRQLAALHNEYKGQLSRQERSAKQAEERAHLAFIKDLLPSFDALFAAIQAAKAPNATTESILEGLDLVQRDMLKTLQKHQVECIDPLPGESFDPRIHEAVGVIESTEFAKNSIYQSFRTGWRHSTGIIRAAMVQTTKEPAPEKPEESPPPTPTESKDKISEVVPKEEPSEETIEESQVIEESLEELEQKEQEA